jgi:hypothetical protein
MQDNSIKIILVSIIFCILTLITIITFINFNDNNYQFYTIYIQAEPSKNNNDNENENLIEKEIKVKEEKKKEKEKDDKKKENKRKINYHKKEDKNKDSRTKEDQDLITKYNYRNLTIPKVYPTAPQGSKYQLKHDNPNGLIQVDETENENVFTKQNRDGSWSVEYGRPRIDIHTKDAGILPDKVEQLNNLSKGKIQSWNYSELKDIGYWYKPSDWKNVEITLIFKLLDSARSKGEDHAISIVTRSISHSQLDSEYKKSKDEPKFYCGGSSYHNNISNDGKIRMKKEQYHINYEWERYKDINNLSVGNIYDKIIGFKAIVYNVNNTAVKLESWVDVENGGKGPYKKVHELIDNGNWGDDMTECGAKTDGQAITWGSPIVILKANDFKFNIYDMEIREIISPVNLLDIQS